MPKSQTILSKCLNFVILTMQKTTKDIFCHVNFLSKSVCITYVNKFARIISMKIWPLRLYVSIMKQSWFEEIIQNSTLLSLKGKHMYKKNQHHMLQFRKILRRSRRSHIWSWGSHARWSHPWRSHRSLSRGLKLGPRWTNAIHF